MGLIEDFLGQIRLLLTEVKVKILSVKSFENEEIKS